jgi:flagellar biosynthesis protein FliR
MSLQLDNVYSLLLIFVRTETTILFVPVLGGTSIPVQIRVGLGMMIAVLLLPVTPAAALAGASTPEIVLAMGYEMLIGLVMGIAILGVLSAISFAAQTITNEIGLLRAETFGAGDSGESGGGIDSLLFYFALLLMLVSGVHRQIIKALAESFQALPAGCMNTRGFSLESVLYVTSRIFVVGVLMSAPFIAVNFLVNVTFSLLGKIAPKMNVFAVSFSIRILAGLAALAGTATLLAHYVEVELSMVPGRMLELVLGR